MVELFLSSCRSNTTSSATPVYSIASRSMMAVQGRSHTTFDIQAEVSGDNGIKARQLIETGTAKLVVMAQDETPALSPISLEEMKCLLAELGDIAESLNVSYSSNTQYENAVFAHLINLVIDIKNVLKTNNRNWE